MALDPRDPRFQRGILGALIVGSIVYVYVFTSWLPFTYQANAAELKTLEEKYRELSKDLNKARQAIDRLPYLEREYELLQKKWEQGKALLPEEPDLTTLLRDVTQIGTSAGVDFTLYKPLPTRPLGDYTELPIEITVAGAYHQVGTFLAEISNMERIVNVSAINVETLPEREGREGQTATATFEAVAYRLGGPPPPPVVAEDEASAKKGPATRKSGSKSSAKKSSSRSKSSGRGGTE